MRTDAIVMMQVEGGPVMVLRQNVVSLHEMIGHYNFMERLEQAHLEGYLAAEQIVEVQEIIKGLPDYAVKWPARSECAKTIPLKF